MKEKPRQFPLVLPVVVAALSLLLIICSLRNTEDLQSDSRKMSRHKQPFTDPELTDVCERLWALDKNRLEPDVDYKLDFQGRTRFSYDGPDRAKDPLFEYVNQEALQRNTYKAFIALLDNYERETGVQETVTDQEKRENRQFTKLVMKSDCMKEAYKFLKSKNVAHPKFKKFRWDFHKMWFFLYRRTRGKRARDSSGFEHVFVGETRGEKKVIGLHNWIQFYLQEKIGNIDYKGFMSAGKNPHLITVQFSWKDEVKPKGSSFVGVSPEFEITLYTLVFLMGYESVRITLGGDDVIINCHRMAGKIGSCYPQIPGRK